MNWIRSVWVLSIVFWGCSEQSPKSNEVELTNYHNPSALIEVEQLIAGISEPYVIIDFRSKEEYMLGHVDGAMYVSKAEIEDSSAAVDGMKLDKQSLQELMRQKGVNKNERIIIYDDKMGCDAARLWWVLKINGCENVSLLNGGWSSFLKAGGKPVTNVTSRNVGDFTFVGRGLGLEAKRQLVESVLNKEGWTIIDARSIDEYRGSKYSRNCQKLGCIPGSMSIDWAQAVDYHGNQKFKSVVDLKNMYETKGVKRENNIITYCRSGVRSAHTTFVLTELLGYLNVYNYDGSWLEWSSLDLPVELKSE